MLRCTTSRFPTAWARSACLAVLLLFGFFFFSRQQQTKSAYHENPIGNSAPELCSNFAFQQNVVVSVKTGASEADQKIPAQSQTSLRCMDNVILFSDLEQDLGEYHLHDALDTVSPSLVSSNPDFKFYSKQKLLWESERNITSLYGARNPENSDELSAWRLDKYKFIHLLEKTWTLKPDKDWYVLIDADTYVLWPNVLRWLSALDPTKKSYIGSEVSWGSTRFAHGGSGIILSKATMYELVVANNGTAEKWDPKMYENCCGDVVLSKALGEYGITLQDVWPLMSGETQFTMPFGPGTPEYWCRPALTLHHLTPTDMKSLGKFEDGRRNNPETLTHAEIFKNLSFKSFPSEQENWDNLASDKGEFGKTGGLSSDVPNFEDCAAACEKDEKCFQYSHHDHTCYIGMSVRRGYAKQADEKGIWRSGWNRTRLENWVAKQPSCNKIIFPGQDR